MTPQDAHMQVAGSAEAAQLTQQSILPGSSREASRSMQTYLSRAGCEDGGRGHRPRNAGHPWKLGKAETDTPLLPPGEPAD